MNCFSQPPPRPLSPVQMCLSCICIVAPLKRSWLMKIRNRMRIVGALGVPVGRNVGRLCSNGLPNLRLDLGHHLSPSALCFTEFAPAQPPSAKITHELVQPP